MRCWSFPGCPVLTWPSIALAAVLFQPASNAFAQRCPPDTEAVNARFAQRERALAIAEDTKRSSDDRLDVVREVAARTQEAAACFEDLKADAVFLRLAAEALATEDTLDAWIQVTLMTFAADRRLPEAFRGVEVAGHDRMQAHLMRGQRFADMARLVVASSGDARLSRVAGDIARDVMWNATPWRDDPSPEQIDRSAAELVHLIGELERMAVCDACTPGWTWRPLLQIAQSYRRVKMDAPARRFAAQATETVRQTAADAELRVAWLGSVLSTLLSWDIDRALAMDVAREVQALAASGAGPHAREWRERLPALRLRYDF